MSVISSTIPPDRFDYFPKLPREVQLLVWDFFEASFLQIRHVFSYLSLDDFEYWEEDRETRRRIWLDFKSAPVDFAAVDSALASRHEISLPRHTRWLAERPHHGTYATFPQPTWMNFKLDRFCFHPMKSTPKMPPLISRMLTGYFPSLKRDKNFMNPQTLKFDMSHWFFRIQHLELHFHDPHTPLGEIDKFAIEVHPSLKTISLMVKHADLFNYREPLLPLGPLPNYRLWLEGKFLELTNQEIIIVSGDVGTILSKAKDPCPYSTHGEIRPAVAAKVLEFQQEIRNLMKHRVVSVSPVVQIKIMGYYWIHDESIPSTI